MNVSSATRWFLVSAALVSSVAANAGAAGAAQVGVAVNGSPLVLNPGPVERAGRVFVPLRGIFERLGASVVYHAGTINAQRNATAVSLQIGSTHATVDGRTHAIEAAPFILGSTTYVPLRFVATALGAVVGYDGSSRLVSVDMAHQPYTPIRPAPPPYVPPNPNPPQVSVVHLRAQQPEPGALIRDRFATISAEFSHRVNANSVRVRLDGNDITSRTGASSTGFSYRPPAPLDFGSHTVRVTGYDAGGSPFDRAWSFTAAAPAPPPLNPIELRSQQPAPGANISNRFAVISAEFSRQADGNSIRVRLDGNDITNRSGTSGTGFSYKPPAPLDFGSHTVRVTGRGPGGQAFDRAWSFSVANEPQKPLHLTIKQPPADAPVGTTFLVQGNTVANGQVVVTAGASPSETGQFRGTTAAGPLGNFNLSVKLTTLMGQQAVTVKVSVTDPVTSKTVSKTLRLRLNQ